MSKSNKFFNVNMDIEEKNEEAVPEVNEVVKEETKEEVKIEEPVEVEKTESDRKNAFFGYKEEEKKEKVVDEDEELERAYVGVKYDRFKTGVFNFGAFFFGMWYLFYRKMYLIGLIECIVSILLGYIFSSIIVSIVLAVIIGFIANPLYLNHVKRSVASIKEMNKDKSFEQLKEICHYQGGTSGVNVILAIVISFAISFAIVFGFLCLKINTTSLATIKDVLNKYHIGFSAKYDGNVYADESVDIEKIINVNVPSTFKSDNTTFKYAGSYSDVSSACDFSIVKVNNVISASNYISNMAKYYSINNTDIKVLKSSDLDWYSIMVNNTYYYATNVNNDVVLYTFKISNDAVNQKTCANYKDSILYTISTHYEESKSAKFNSEYEAYKGEKYGNVVNSLIDKVVLSNKSSKKVIVVDFGGTLLDDNNKMTDVKESVDSSVVYNISYEYDSEGFINKIIISEKK